MKSTPAGRFVARLLCLMFLLTLSPRQASAWGAEGHRIVARIAAKHLTAKTQKMIATIIKADKEDLGHCKQLATLEDQMACVATWADQVRGSDEYKSTAGFHFVNIPIYVPPAQRHYDEKYCKNGCTVTALASNRSILATSKDNAARAIALKFIVHFVGDLHQPLHNANDKDLDFNNKENTAVNHEDLKGTGDNDRGANLKLVVWLGQTATQYGCWNLHAVWDEGIIEKKSSSDSDYANDLNQGLDLAKLKKGSVIDWVNEAFDLAVTKAYGSLPQPVASDRVCELKTGSGKDSKTECVPYAAELCKAAEVHYRYQLDESYYEKNLPVIEGQLQRGGVRLAQFLNSIFDPTGKMP